MLVRSPTPSPRDLMRPTPVLASVLAVVLLLGACSQKDPSAKDVREDLSAALQDGEDGLTKDQADCYAKLIVAEVGVDAINDVDFKDQEPSGDLADDIAAAAVTARATCDIAS